MNISNLVQQHNKYDQMFVLDFPFRSKKNMNLLNMNGVGVKHKENKYS